MSLGSKIYELRRLRNMTQENLADILGVTRQSISRWEADIVYPDLEKIVKLSNVLEVSCDYLLKDEENIEKNKKPISRLLVDLVGKDVSIAFYDDAPDYDLYNDKNKCIVKEIDNGSIKLELTVSKKNKVKNIIIPLNIIKSVIIKGEM